MNRNTRSVLRIKSQLFSGLRELVPYTYARFPAPNIYRAFG
jgi:hypothetical protein